MDWIFWYCIMFLLLLALVDAIIETKPNKNDDNLMNEIYHYNCETKKKIKVMGVKTGKVCRVYCDKCDKDAFENLNYNDYSWCDDEDTAIQMALDFGFVEYNDKFYCEDCK